MSKLIIKELNCRFNVKKTSKNGKSFQSGSLGKAFYLEEFIQYQNYVYFGDKEITETIYNVELGKIEIRDYKDKKTFNLTIKDFESVHTSTQTPVLEVFEEEAVNWEEEVK